MTSVCAFLIFLCHSATWNTKLLPEPSGNPSPKPLQLHGPNTTTTTFWWFDSARIPQQLNQPVHLESLKPRPRHTLLGSGPPVGPSLATAWYESLNPKRWWPPKLHPYCDPHKCTCKKFTGVGKINLCRVHGKEFWITSCFSWRWYDIYVNMCVWKYISFCISICIYIW